ncbi:unnamed protein product, partial [Ceratitis capitata]
MFQAMQKRIDTFKSSLKVAHQKIKEHESAKESQSAKAHSIANASIHGSAHEAVLTSSSLPMSNFLSPIVTSQTN